MSRRFGRNRKRKLLAAHHAVVAANQAEVARLKRRIDRLEHDADNPFEDTIKIDRIIPLEISALDYSKGAEVPEQEMQVQQVEFDRLDMGIRDIQREDAYLAYVAVKGRHSCIYVSMSALERSVRDESLKGLVDELALKLMTQFHMEIRKGSLRTSWR